MSQAQTRGWVNEDEFKTNKESERKSSSSLETRVMTGQEMIDIYIKQNEQYERINRGRESQKAFIAAIPETQDKPVRGTSEVVKVSREEELRNIARREAITVLTKGEYKRRLSKVKSLDAVKASQPLSDEQEKQHEKALTRIAVMNKFANHPNQAKEMQRLLQYCFEKNCTEKGINETIAATTAKIDANTSMIEQLKGVENDTFTVNIKHDKSLGSLRVDEDFSKQLEAALEAKKVAMKEKPAKKQKKDAAAAI